ncbi:hypothetical protein GOODEAATRI_028682 [Goodea atripinnis]|uniref:Uncharacterized protein n=1 Tax=Goodea atripinnis TaxID=208336 RepID=A0ABV0NYM1_9TELE
MVDTPLQHCWDEDNLNKGLYIGFICHQSRTPSLVTAAAKQTFHPPLTQSFPATSQMFYLPSWPWTPLLLHVCLQVNQEMLTCTLPSPSYLSVSRLNQNKAAGPHGVSPEGLGIAILWDSAAILKP